MASDKKIFCGFSYLSLCLNTWPLALGHFGPRDIIWTILVEVY